MDIVCEIASPEGEPTEESPESDYAQTEEPKETEAHEEVQNSNVIREAAKDVKHRILLEKHIFSYDICYRRVKHTNELVINGKVYDEIQGIMEYPHTLKAWIDGHYVSVGYTGTHSFITFDGDTIAKKLRIV